MIKTASFFFFVLIFFPASAFSASVCKHVSMQFISRHLPLPVQARIIKKQERGSICEVILQTKNELAPIYVGKDFVLIGQLLQKKKSVTAQTMEQLAKSGKEKKEQLAMNRMLNDAKKKSFLKTHIARLRQFVAITLKPQGPARDEIYVVTDPACSHCKKLLSSLQKLTAQSVAIHIIIYPVLGTTSQKLTEAAICRQSSFGEYMELNKSSRLTSRCQKGKKYIEATCQFLEQADITSVPLTVGPEAKWLVEGNRVDEIKRHLSRDDDMCRPTKKTPCD